MVARVKQGQTNRIMLVQQVNLQDHIYIMRLLINGKKVNSQKLKLPSGKILKGNDRKTYLKQKKLN